MKCLFLSILFLYSNSALSDDFNTEPQPIETIDIPIDYKRVSYNDKYTLAIPKDFKIERSDINKKVFGVRSSSGGLIIMIDELLASNKIILNPERYGFDGNNRRQLLSAIYDKNHVTNDEVNEARELIFESLNNLVVYKRGGFLFIREDRKDDTTIKTSLTISSPKNDEIITMSFTVDNEDLILNVIKSLKVN